MPNIAKKSLLRKMFKKHLFSSFQKTKTTQTSGSVFAERIEKVKKTKVELELVKIVNCFGEGRGTSNSNLVFFEIKPLYHTILIVTVRESNDCSQKKNASWKRALEAKNFKSCQISEQKIYNLSEYLWLFVQRVRFWIEIFTTRQILKNNFWKAWFWKKNSKSTILKTKIFFKGRFAHKKITFWFKLPSKMRKFCVLRAILKNTILRKMFSLKTMILNVKIFLKSMILKEKVFVKSMILS